MFYCNTGEGRVRSSAYGRTGRVGATQYPMIGHSYGRGRYTGGALEQIVNRRTDCQLSIVGAGGIPIVLI